MKQRKINIEIFLSNNESLQISCPQINKYFAWSKISENSEDINSFFNELCMQKITNCYENGNNRILCLQNENNDNYQIIFKEYDKLFNVIKCQNIDRKMTYFCLNRAINNIKNKLNIKITNLFKEPPVKAIIAGSILSTSIILPSILTYNNINKHSETLQHMEYNLEEKITNQEILNDVNIEIPTTNDIDIIEDINNSQNIDFSELEHYSSINDYISFASKLYGIDIETSNRILEDKINNMEQYINNSNNKELKNLYELNKLGIIDCDLNIVGTFIIIKNYANDLETDNSNPIISNKSESEKEKDLINIARYIYGINDTEILNIIIAIHRLETGYGTSSYALKLNNLGGNMNPNPSEEQIKRYMQIMNKNEINIEQNPIPNIYKTTEIGAESMVRNVLNIYTKCLHDEECLNKTNIAEFLSKKYCTHTPENWANTINNMLNEGNIQEDVNKYINSNNKIM